MAIIVGIMYAIGLVIIFIYSAIAVKHAVRFRYLSPRTTHITILYLFSASILVVTSAYAFFAATWN